MNRQQYDNLLQAMNSIEADDSIKLRFGMNACFLHRLSIMAGSKHLDYKILESEYGLNHPKHTLPIMFTNDVFRTHMRRKKAVLKKIRKMLETKKIEVVQDDQEDLEAGAQTTYKPSIVKIEQMELAEV